MFFLADLVLPDQCTPTNDFLYHVSRLCGTCIPTPLAFISTVLGICSIVSWLFAQVPQILKNFQLHSTSGLSIFFLGEWLLGDASNLFGCIFTQQASWQVILATYYCVVDCVLVGQWIWYEHLKHGRVVRKVKWWRWNPGADDPDMTVRDQQLKKAKAVAVSQVPAKSQPILAKGRSLTHEESEGSWRPSSLFRIPKFALSYSSVDSTLASSPNGESQTETRPQRILRPPRPESPLPSPRTVLYITLLLALSAQATPITSPSLSPSTTEPLSSSDLLGRIFSWLSTLLYLGSRMPQLLHNYTRRSTEGLSPTLFAAAFCGNFFYSTSMLTNPFLWSDMPALGGHGWAGPEGNLRGPWAIRATPFFLGAAGVLFMDGMIGVQFLMYATTGKEAARMLVVEEEGVRGAGRWRRVSGWMRGWVPSAASRKKGSLTIVDLYGDETDAETESLLSQGWDSESISNRTPRLGPADSGRSYGAVGR